MMKRAGRSRSGILVAVLIGLVALPCGLMWRAWRQTSLNRALIAAIHHNSAAQVRFLLAQKADPNAHERLLYELFLDSLHGNKPKVTSSPSALVVALYLDSTQNTTASSENTALIKALLDAGARE